MKKGKSTKDKESKRNVKKDSKKELKDKDSKKDLKKIESVPEDRPSSSVNPSPRGTPKDSSHAAKTAAGGGGGGGGGAAGKLLMSSYDNWNRDKWSMGASEINKGLRSWNFKMEPMKVRLPAGGSKKYIFEDCWVILHLEFILIWRNHVDKMMPPQPTVPPDDFISLAKLNPKFVEKIEGRTQKDSFIGERLLKFENTFRVGTNDNEYLFECASEEDMKVWISLVTDSIVALLRSRKYFTENDPDALWEIIQKHVPINFTGVLRDPFKEGEEEAWLDKVMQIKTGYEKYNEAMKRLKVWSRYFCDATQFYMEWMSAPNNADHGVGRELVNAQDRICEKWKVKFHDFKSLEKHFPELPTMTHGRRDKMIQHTEKMLALCDLYSKYFQMLNGRPSPYGPVRKKWEIYRDQIQAVKDNILAEEERRRKEEEKERQREIKRQKKRAKELLALQAKENKDPFSDVNVFRHEDPFNDVWVDDVVNMYGELDNGW